MRYIAPYLALSILDQNEQALLVIRSVFDAGNDDIVTDTVFRSFGGGSILIYALVRLNMKDEIRQIIEEQGMKDDVSVLIQALGAAHAEFGHVRQLEEIFQKLLVSIYGIESNKCQRPSSQI